MILALYDGKFQPTVKDLGQDVPSVSGGSLDNHERNDLVMSLPHLAEWVYD